MRAYVLMSGVLYFLLVLAHVARLVAEGTSVASSPMFSLTTVAATLMTAWSWWLFRRVRDGSAVYPALLLPLRPMVSAQE